MTTPDTLVKLDSIRRGLDQLSKRRDQSVAAMRIVLRLSKEVQTLIESLGEPDFFPVAEKPKSRGDQMEVRDFALSLGLSASDADWFYFKCEGCGWKNNGKPIVDWKSTVRAWEKVGVFPSQKVTAPNGRPVTGSRPMTPMEREAMDDLAKLRGKR